MICRNFLGACLALLTIVGIASADPSYSYSDGDTDTEPPAVAEPVFGSNDAEGPAKKEEGYRPVPVQTFCCPPTTTSWEVSAGALFLAREYKSTPIVSNVPVATTTLVSSGDFDRQYEAGFEVSARNDKWEVRYLQVDAFSDAVTLNQFGQSLAAPFAPGTVLGYDAELYSGEVNRYFRPAHEAIRPFAGLRYLQLDETLNFDITNRINITRLTADNNLYGFQAGVDACLVGRDDSCFFLNTFAKGGIYYADTKVINSTPVFGLVAADSESEVAFVGEAAITAGCRLTHWLTIDASYQALWLSGVALAGEQASTTTILPPATTANHGDMLFHGFRFGGTASW